VREDAPGPLVAWYRHISKGAWPFSTRDHGWPISDCSSEGLKARCAAQLHACDLLLPHSLAPATPSALTQPVNDSVGELHCYVGCAESR
jgi:hypothetical protein